MLAEALLRGDGKEDLDKLGPQGMISGHPVLETRENDEALLPLLVSPHHPSVCRDLQVKHYQIRGRKDRGDEAMNLSYAPCFSAAC